MIPDLKGYKHLIQTNNNVYGDATNIINQKTFQNIFYT